MYTIRREGGARDLVLEHGLSGLETEFTRIRNSKLNFHRDLDDREHVMLCAFTAAAQARTPRSREHHQSQWGRVLDLMDDLHEKMKTATPEQRRNAAAISASPTTSGTGFTHEQVKQLHANPLQTLLRPAIQTITPLLCKLDLAVYVSADDIGFITSDHPCVWFDPESYRRPPMYRGPALMYDTIEITLPLSPSLCLFLNRRGISGYIDAHQIVVNELNRRTRFYADEQIVVRKNTLREYWFQQGVEPADSWNNLHSKKSSSDS